MDQLRLNYYPDARIFVLDGDGMHESRYQDTEHYAVTRAFLQDPARMLRDVFAEIERAEDD